MSMWELALIAIITLLVVKPAQLPALARQLGVWVGQLRRWINQLNAQAEAQLKYHELQQRIDAAAKVSDVDDLLAPNHRPPHDS